MHRPYRLTAACIVFLGFSLRMGVSIGTQTSPSSPAVAKVRIPLVGCKSDGQVGPLEAPGSSTVEVELDARVAERVALYKAMNGSAVLGPRGWSCFGIYGSSASRLYIMPQAINFDDVSRSSGVTGFGIEGSLIDGETSGRFTIAQIAARIFPTQKALVQSVLDPAVALTLGPFPGDSLRYLNERVVEYETPAGSTGLGTFFQLRPNHDSVRGAVILIDAPHLSLGHLALRLPQGLDDLLPAITRQFEER